MKRNLVLLWKRGDSIGSPSKSKKFFSRKKAREYLTNFLEHTPDYYQAQLSNEDLFLNEIYYCSLLSVAGVKKSVYLTNSHRLGQLSFEQASTLFYDSIQERFYIGEEAVKKWHAEIDTTLNFFLMTYAEKLKFKNGVQKKNDRYWREALTVLENMGVNVERLKKAL